MALWGIQHLASTPENGDKIMKNKLTIEGFQQMLVSGHNPYIDIKNPDKVLLHLVEEVGEVARTHRHLQKDNIEGFQQMLVSGQNPYIDIWNERTKLEMEIGDVAILLSFYASSMNVNLAEAIHQKILMNIQTGRFGMKK
jgi:NTP pyrophosphatase (non-canonical NTP hydrolase)